MQLPRTGAVLACAVALATTLAACGFTTTTSTATGGASDTTSGSASGSGSGSGSGSASGNATAEATAASSDSATFPVTIPHAFGETTIESEPQRVVALGWGTPDAAVALGVTPVGVEEQVWTVDDGNHLPWLSEAITAAGDDLPTLLTNDFTTPAYEEIIALEPDLVLAQYSGYTEEHYEVLSDIAPTVMYPENAWSTPWRDVISITGQALGREDAAAGVLEDIGTFMADQAAAHPEFDGVTLANLWDEDGFVSVYTGDDPRVAMMTELGFEVAPSVAELDTDDAEANFFYELSYEVADQLGADVVISYHSTQDEADAFLAKQPLQAIPAVADGHVAQVVGNEQISSVSPPTALSVEWGMPDLVDDLAEVLGEE